jgi:hypothetical protein
LLDFVGMASFSWPLMLGAIGGLVLVSILVVWGVRILGRKERHEEAASQIGVDLASALARDPRLRGAAILPVVTIPVAGRPSVEVTGRVTSAGVRDLALEVVNREATRLRPGMDVVDRLEIVPASTSRTA